MTYVANKSGHSVSVVMRKFVSLFSLMLKIQMDDRQGWHCIALPEQSPNEAHRGLRCRSSAPALKGNCSSWSLTGLYCTWRCSTVSNVRFVMAEAFKLSLAMSGWTLSWCQALQKHTKNMQRFIVHFSVLTFDLFGNSTVQYQHRFLWKPLICEAVEGKDRR